MATTTNYYIGPQDGWVEIVSDGWAFVRTSAVPHNQQYYLYTGATPPSLMAAAATGTVTFSTGLPTAGQTVTVGSETYTFRTGTAPLPFDVLIGADFAATAVNFTTKVNSSSTLVTAVNVPSVVTLTAKAAGTQGNYALSKTATNVAVSGAALTGGAPQQLGVLVCHHPFKVNVADADSNLYARVPNPCADSVNKDGRFRLDVFVIPGS